MASKRGKDLPPKCNSVALYGAAFPFLLFLFFCLIHWHLAFFSFLDTFPLAQNFPKCGRGGGARKENCGRERACTREGEDRERACTREGEDGEEGVVVMVEQKRQ